MNSDRTEKQLTPADGVVERECEKHGPYQLPAWDVFGDGELRALGGCPECAAARDAERAARDSEMAEIERRAVIASRLAAARIPERFAHKGLSDFRTETPEQERVLTVCQRFAESDKQGLSLVMCGGPGTGKTHLACGLIRAWVQRQRLCQYTTVLQAIRSIKATYRRDAPRTEEDVIRSLVGLDLLVLDEVGVQLGSEHELVLMFEVVNERYARMKSTVLISNLSRDELGDYLGDRMMDRFQEGGAVLALDWESWRGRRVA